MSSRFTLAFNVIVRQTCAWVGTYKPYDKYLQTGVENFFSKRYSVTPITLILLSQVKSKHAVTLHCINLVLNFSMKNRQQCFSFNKLLQICLDSKILSSLILYMNRKQLGKPSGTKPRWGATVAQLGSLSLTQKVDLQVLTVFHSLNFKQPCRLL